MIRALLAIFFALALVASTLAAPVASPAILAESDPSDEPTTSRSSRRNLNNIPAPFAALIPGSQHAFVAAGAPAPAYAPAPVASRPVAAPVPAALTREREQRLAAVLTRAYGRFTGRRLALGAHTRAALHSALRSLRTQGAVRVSLADLAPPDSDDAAALSAEDVEVRVRAAELDAPARVDAAGALREALSLDVGGAAVELFAAGSALPAQRTQMFTEATPEGTLTLRVYAQDAATGERTLSDTFLVAGIVCPVGSKRVPLVSVAFALGADGALTVDARDADSNTELAVVRY